MAPSERFAPWVYSYLPWSFWHHMESFGTFMECERARIKAREEARSQREEMLAALARLSDAEREELKSSREVRENTTLLTKMWARMEHAECQAIR